MKRASLQSLYLFLEAHERVVAMKTKNDVCRGRQTLVDPLPMMQCLLGVATLLPFLDLDQINSIVLTAEVVSDHRMVSPLLMKNLF
jgi:hypothetical protein